MLLAKLTKTQSEINSALDSALRRFFEDPQADLISLGNLCQICVVQLGGLYKCLDC